MSITRAFLICCAVCAVAGKMGALEGPPFEREIGLLAGAERLQTAIHVLKENANEDQRVVVPVLRHDLFDSQEDLIRGVPGDPVVPHIKVGPSLRCTEGRFRLLRRKRMDARDSA